MAKVERSFEVLFAFFALLGAKIAVLLLFATRVIGRRRWMKRQPGVFAGAIRVSGGTVDGFNAKWKRGSGRWVHDVFVWSKAPFHSRYELVPIGHVSGERQSVRGALKGVGEHPAITELMSDAATLEVATRPEDRLLALGPFGAPATTNASAAIKLVDRDAWLTPRAAKDEWIQIATRDPLLDPAQER